LFFHANDFVISRLRRLLLTAIIPSQPRRPWWSIAPIAAGSNVCRGFASLETIRDMRRTPVFRTIFLQFTGRIACRAAGAAQASAEGGMGTAPDKRQKLQARSMIVTPVK
jgi:hypothetical protein